MFTFLKNSQKEECLSNLYLANLRLSDVSKIDDTFFQELCRRFSLLKTLMCSNTVKIFDLAEELKMSRTDLMAYILEHRGHFVLETPKVGVGLGISMIFKDLEENPLTDEWLEKKIKDNEKNVWMTPIVEYNAISGWQLLESADDPTDSTMNRFRSKWKNTKEKIKAVENLNFLHKQQFYFGAFSERVPRIFDNACLDAEKKDMIEKFKNAGWNLIFDKA